MTFHWTTAVLSVLMFFVFRYIGRVWIGWRRKVRQAKADIEWDYCWRSEFNDAYKRFMKREEKES